MTRATPIMRELAGHLIALEAKENKAAGKEVSTAFAVCDKLRPQLANLMGNVGFRTVLSRAMALARVEVPWLRAAHVKADGSIEGLTELESHISPAEIAEGELVLLAHLLGLLTVFIGEKLTLGILRERWPKLALNDADLGKG